MSSTETTPSAVERMAWTAARKHADKQIDGLELELFRNRVPQRLEQFCTAAAVDRQQARDRSTCATEPLTYLEGEAFEASISY